MKHMFIFLVVLVLLSSCSHNVGKEMVDDSGSGDDGCPYAYCYEGENPAISCQEGQILVDGECVMDTSSFE